MRQPAKYRFSDYVFHEPNTGCHLWSGAVGAHGHGRMRFLRGDKWTHVGAHVYALSVVLGRWPVGFVLHSCDNPSCVNPDHLREGSHADNMRDMTSRNRQAMPKGESHPAAILNDDMVRDIRARRARGESRSSVAAALGISYWLTRNVDSGISWTHV